MAYKHMANEMDEDCNDVKFKIEAAERRARREIIQLVHDCFIPTGKPKYDFDYNKFQKLVRKLE